MHQFLFSLVVSGVCFAYPITNDENPRITIGLGTGDGSSSSDNFTKTYVGDTEDVDGYIERTRNKTSDDKSTSRPLTPSAVLGFMKKFGYLAAGAPNTEALYTKEAVIGAI